MLKWYKILFTLIMMCFSTLVSAQKNVETQSLSWTRYYLKTDINENYRLNQELEERVFWFPWRQHQFLSRTRLERKLGKGWKAEVGFTYFLQTLPHDPNIDDTNNRTELRPQLGLSYKQSLSSKFSLHHRYWNEFRFIEQPDDSFKYKNLRVRYKIELRYNLTEKMILKVFDEIHLNFGDDVVLNTFNQNRIGGSVLYNFNKKIGVELGYFNWFQQRSSGVDYFNRNIVRLTFRHKLNLFNN